MLFKTVRVEKCIEHDDAARRDPGGNEIEYLFCGAINVAVDMYKAEGFGFPRQKAWQGFIELADDQFHISFNLGRVALAVEIPS